MSVVSTEDINYYAQQSSKNINRIISGMMALMKDTDNRVKAMESQPWFQRMIRTVTGKNKLSKKEIRKNHEKLNAYMSQAIMELYNRGCIEQKVLLSLGTQINELHAEHLQLKGTLGAFVSKLNEKIDSIDNFHMLTEEIILDLYSGYARITAICMVISQFDRRILGDGRKQEIIRKSLTDKKIINDDKISVKSLFMDIIEIPESEMGQIYLELNTIRGNPVAGLITEMMEKYHFLPDDEKKEKDNKKEKRTLVKEEISQSGLYDSLSFTYNEIYDGFLNSKINVVNRLSKGDCGYWKDALEGQAGSDSWGMMPGDVEKADEWHRKAADTGNSQAAVQIGIQELEKQNYEEAVKYFKKAAGKGNAEAQNRLAMRYSSGQGIEKNMKEAFKWYLKAAEQGHVQGMYNAGQCYYLGIGVEPDRQKAADYLRKSAELGYESAQRKLMEWKL